MTAPADAAPAAAAGASAPAAVAPVIAVRELRKAYGRLVAVNDISFDVRRGEVFGILGPNGAGKTTTLEMIEGIRPPDGGGVTVDGRPVWPDPREVKGRIGVQLQATALFEYQRLHEIIYLFGSCYGIHRPRAECIELLDRVGIGEKANAYANELSGGQAQRLSIALALVNDPVVTFLDEPTTGLDPRARRALWDVIRDINRAGTTVVLTSHYMEEAQRLCDRVAVMDQGHIMALDTPQALISQLGAQAHITFTLSERLPLHDLCDLAGAEGCHAGEEQGYAILTTDAQTAVTSLLGLAAARGLAVENLDISGANLEDVFLSMTGRKLSDDETQVAGEEAPAAKRRLFGGRR